MGKSTSAIAYEYIHHGDGSAYDIGDVLYCLWGDGDGTVLQLCICQYVASYDYKCCDWPYGLENGVSRIAMVMAGYVVYATSLSLVAYGMNVLPIIITTCVSTCDVWR